MGTRIEIQQAGGRDRDELRAMQAASFRILGGPFYDEDVVESFIADVGTMDDYLLDDGTYFKAVEDGRIVGSGGWSCRTPTYISRGAAELPTSHVARASVRSVFVHPDCARRGIARAIMARIETEIAAAGFATAALAATLSGIAFYRRLGYRSGQPLALRLPNELTFVALRMEKSIAGRPCGAGRASQQPA
jgi:GNAT superfamily N-acetyltransferase